MFFNEAEQSEDGETDDVKIVAVDLFDEDGGFVLEAVRACFVKGFFRVDIGVDLVCGKVTEGDLGDLVADRDLSAVADGDTAYHLMSSTRKGGEHTEGVGAVGGLSEYLVSEGDDGVTRDDHIVFAAEGQYSLGFSDGKAFRERLGRKIFGYVFVCLADDYFRIEPEMAEYLLPAGGL